MIGGDFPWRGMTSADVRVLALAGFNAHEVATVAGVPDDVGAFLRDESLGISWESPSYPQEWTLRDDVCRPDGSVPAVDRAPMPFWTNGWAR